MMIMTKKYSIVMTGRWQAPEVEVPMTGIVQLQTTIRLVKIHTLHSAAEGLVLRW